MLHSLWHTSFLQSLKAPFLFFALVSFISRLWGHLVPKLSFMFLSECLVIPHSKTFLVTCMIWQNSWCDHSYNAPSFSIIRTRGVSWIEQLYPSTVLCSLNSESPLEQELLGLSLTSESPITFWVKVVPHWQGNQPALCRNGLDCTNEELFTKKRVMRDWGNIQSHPWRKFSNPKMRLSSWVFWH